MSGTNNVFGLNAQLKFMPTFTDEIDGKVEARFTLPDITRHEDPDGELLEGYINIRLDKLDIRLGKQNVVWGRADYINPTDNLTPRDYTILLPFEEDQRTGTYALKLDYHVSPEYTVTVFTTPSFEPSTITLLLPKGSLVSENKPSHSLSHGEVGVKFDKSGGNLDWSISYYHRFSLFPAFKGLGFSPFGQPLIELHYPEMNVIGADFARNFGPYGIRVEAAYIMPVSEPTGFISMQPYLYYVLGADRTFRENLNVNLQFIGRWVEGFKPLKSVNDPFQRAVSSANQIVFNQQDCTNYGMSARVSKKWFNDTLEAEIRALLNFYRTNSYVRPLITYTFTDHIKGSIGAEYYSGPQDSFFGSMKSIKGMFAELRYNF